MADEVKSLLIQVSATTELLRSNLIAAERQIDSFTKSAEASGAKVQRSVEQAGSSSASARTGFQQLGFQIQDFAVQVAGGTSAVRALSQQLPQAIGAAQLMFSSTSKVGQFLGGPWGVALGTAAAVLVPFIGQLFETEKALDKVGKAAQDAMAKLRSSLAQADAFTDAATDRAKRIISGRGQIAQLDRGIAAIEGHLATNPGAPLNGKFSVQLREDLQLIRRERARLAAGMDSAQSDLNSLSQLRRVQAMQEDRSEIFGRTPKAPARPRSGGRGATPKASPWEEFLADGSQGIIDDVSQQLRVIGVEYGKLTQQLQNDEFEQAKRLIDDKRDYEFERRRDVIERLKEAEARQIQFLGGLFENAFRGGTKAIWRDFKDLGSAVIGQLLARFAAAQLSGKGGSFNFGSALSKSLGSILGFADGGRPPIGRVSMVGERGPELFIPDVAGTIIPNGGFGGGGGPSITINAPGATAETVAMIRREIAAVLPAAMGASSGITMRNLSRRKL